MHAHIYTYIYIHTHLIDYGYPGGAAAPTAGGVRHFYISKTEDKATCQAHSVPTRARTG